jgi:tol-pal system protein YbgF
MTKTGPAKAGFAIAFVAAVAFVPMTGAKAEWWNPFKQQRPNQAEPLPPPPDTPVPPANVGTQTGGPTNLAPAGNQPAPSFGNPDAITSPPRSGGDPVALSPPVDATTRIDRIEQSLRDLTGQLEQVTFEIGKLRDELSKLQQDTEYRFQSIDNAERPPQQRSDSSTGPDFGAAEPHPEGRDATATATESTSTGATETAAEPDAIATAISGTQLGAPERPLGTLTLDGSQPGGGNVVDGTVAPPAAPGEQPLNLSSLTGGPEPTPAPDPNAGIAPVTPGAAVASIAPSQIAGTPTDVYNRSYQYVLDGDYVQAEQSFRAFLVAFPTDKRAPDAQYWIGDSLFQRGMYREAGQEFNSGYRAYPKSGKAPDSLLRLGMSLTALGQREAACAVYSELVKRYPDAPHALLQKVKAEQTSGTC